MLRTICPAIPQETKVPDPEVRALLDTLANRNGLSRRACWTALAAVLAMLLPLAKW